jgi:hypothetical protein
MENVEKNALKFDYLGRYDRYDHITKMAEEKVEIAFENLTRQY